MQVIISHCFKNIFYFCIYAATINFVIFIPLNSLYTKFQMKENILFVFKSIFLGAIASTLLGGLVGYIYQLLVTDHAHQIMSTAFIITLLSTVAGATVSSITAIYMAATQKQHLKLLLLITWIATVLLVFSFGLYLHLW